MLEELLADFLGNDISEIQLWSDDSMTIEGDTRHEYILSETKRDDFMHFLGKSKGWYIYKN